MPTHRPACVLPSVASLVLAVVWSGVATPPASAASPAEQKTAIRRAGSYLRTVKRLVASDRNGEAVEMYGKAKEMLSAAAEGGVDSKLEKSFQRTAEQFAATHQTLKQAGLVEGEPPSFAGALSGGPAGDGRFDPRNISFVRDVAPVLSAKCGGCHIDRRAGGFSLASYRDLMQGPGAGRVIVPGDGQSSMLIEIIVSGDMPRGGDTVSPQQVRLLMDWITQGAKFDGADESVNLRTLKPGAGVEAAAAKAPKQPAVARPKGKETVSFALDVAPILSAKCADCHGAGRQQSGFSLETLADLLKGGDGGAAVAAKNPGASSLIRRVKGDDEPRMPLNRQPLSTREIEVLETWVREGAVFDGPEADTPLERVTSVVRAEKATPDELSGIRAALAAKNWRLAMPNTQARSAKTQQFYVVGNLPETRLQEIGEQAERVAGRVLKLFAHPEGEPLAKGRVTLYAMAQRIDYSEFGLMVLRRELPRDEPAVWGFDLVDGYAAMQLGVAPEPRDEAVLTEAVAAVYLMERTADRLPEWLVSGSARVAAARLVPKDSRVASWEEDLPEQAPRLRKPGDLLANKLPPATAGVLRWGFADALMRKPSKLHAVINAAADGKPLDDAFLRSYGKTAEELVPLWLNSLKRRR